MRTSSLLASLVFGQPHAARSTPPDAAIGDVPSIVELVGSIVAASRSLEGLLQFLVLIAAIGVVAVALHIWHKRDAVTLSLFALLSLAVCVAAFVTRHTRNELQAASQSRLFLPLGESRDLGPFSIKLSDVDTLKLKIKDGEIAPWSFNRTFGDQALRDFLELGKVRLEADFLVDAEAFAQWPTFEQISQITAADDEDAWKDLLDRLRSNIENSRTERTVAMKRAFSRWPLVELTVREIKTDKTLVSRYFPDRSIILIHDSDGIPYRIAIETVFNGDRDLGEAEACVLGIEEAK